MGATAQAASSSIQELREFHDAPPRDPDISEEGRFLAQAVEYLGLTADALSMVAYRARLAELEAHGWPPRVQRWRYENPLTLGLVQGVPPGVELATLAGVLLGVLKVLLGSGPRERAQAEEIRARIEAVTGRDGPVPSDRVVRASEALRPYDWSIERIE